VGNPDNADQIDTSNGHFDGCYCMEYYGRWQNQDFFVGSKVIFMFRADQGRRDEKKSLIHFPKAKHYTR